ncbi:hypothetical protein, partial [Salmonella enterica]|uniref:hypothetical protein n=1 Tax=Salmonella enterica TaxID=28901 RepID=UPI002EC52D2D|nr:hypothetical protein [Salmonella enterica subsp. enterica serovar Paratyphi A]
MPESVLQSGGRLGTSGACFFPLCLVLYEFSTYNSAAVFNWPKRWVCQNPFYNQAAGWGRQAPA